ncbi:MAG TPA: S9 family peptidase [Acidobacteriaceae bacterium]|jgi:dipeptidyl aminopeptidase/acylaminoacyl peptidase|nr:S9 family peptidase [Acidobacteriaceae bacterium]
MRRLFLISLALIALTFSAFAQVKHPFTFEDMMKLKRVGEPEVSPDGKWVIFSVVKVDLAANTKTPHIWIVPTAGGQEREIIADQDADRPRWAPDGKRFAFVSTKEGGSQVWVADFDGDAGTVSAVHRLTSIATEASGELWSPDGNNILFTSDVYPECDGAPVEEQDCNAKKLKDAEQSKVKALIFTHLLYRHWNAYKEGKRTHIFIVPTKLPSTARAVVVSADAKPRPLPFEVSSSLIDLTPGDYDAPVFSLGGQDDYAFSPDGKEICYTSNHDKNPAASTNNDLWIVPVNGAAGASSAGVLAKTKNITADNPASDSSPLYSPDGRYIAYRAQQRPGYESDRFRLMLYDRRDGSKHELTPDSFDSWVGSFTWDPRAPFIFMPAEEKGTAAIYRLAVWYRAKAEGTPGLRGTAVTGGGPVLQRVSQGFDDDVAVSPDGSSLLFTRMSIASPTEIEQLAASSTFSPSEPPRGEQLTHLNDAVLSQVAMSPLEPFWFTGAHNDKVEGFLVKPPNFDASKKYPVKFLIHGGPQGAWGDDWSYRWNPELFAAPTSSTSSGYVVIMINFHGSTGYGQKFIDAINGDWGGAPFEDLMKGLDYAEEHYAFIDKTRECALGASYGGYMANWILGHTDRFKCIVTHDGMFNAESAWGTTEELWFNDWEFKGTPYDNRAMYEKWSPHQYAKNFKTPTLVIHGQKDYRLDVSEGFQLFTTLQMEGVPSEMLYFPDEGHWVQKPQNSQLWYKTVNDWVDRWTKK